MEDRKKILLVKLLLGWLCYSLVFHFLFILSFYSFFLFFLFIHSFHFHSFQFHLQFIFHLCRKLILVHANDEEIRHMAVSRFFLFFPFFHFSIFVFFHFFFIYLSFLYSPLSCCNFLHLIIYC
jgi:hypothetical protein